MDDNVYLAAFFFPAAAAVLVFFMKYVSAILQARVRMAQDEAYREIAAKATAAQADAAATLATFGAALRDIQSQLDTIGKILKDV